MTPHVASTLARMSLNQMTIRQWSLRQIVDACVRTGIPAVGLWRESVEDVGLAVAGRMVADAGLRVSSYCRGGFLTTSIPRQRRAAIDNNRRALDEAASLGARCLVVVAGGLPDNSRDLAGARGRFEHSIGELAAHAEAVGVPLALEPLHPVFCADRCVLSTLGQALDIAEHFSPAQVGIVVDAFHVWWDPALGDGIRRASGRILSFQVCDWGTPVPADVLNGRGMMGSGRVDLRSMRRAVEEVGYDGDTEVEIFNTDLWASDGDVVLESVIRTYADHVLEGHVRERQEQT